MFNKRIIREYLMNSPTETFVGAEINDCSNRIYLRFICYEPFTERYYLHRIVQANNIELGSRYYYGRTSRGKPDYIRKTYFSDENSKKRFDDFARKRGHRRV